MINKTILTESFDAYDENRKILREKNKNQNKLYEIKQLINRNNIKYKHDFIIEQFTNMYEHNETPETNYLYNNINWAIKSIINLNDNITALPEIIKTTISVYKSINEIIAINGHIEFMNLNIIANKILVSQQINSILEEIELTKRALVLIRSTMSSFRKELSPDEAEIEYLKNVYKKVEKEITKVIDLSVLNKEIDLALQLNNELLKKTRDMGFIYCDADLFWENDTYRKDMLYEKKEIEQSKYKQLYVFEDKSLLLKNKEGDYIEILDNYHVTQIKKEIMIESIKYELRKHPTLTKLMINVINKTNKNYNMIATIIKTYQEHITILKNSDFNIAEEFSIINEDYNYKELEKISDHLDGVIKKHKVKVFAYSIASKKYHTLYNEETLLLMNNIHDLKLDSGILQNEIGKKLAVYKDSQEFNRALYKFYEYIAEVTKDKIIKKSQDLNAKIIQDNDSVVIVQIENFNQSEILGSASWCISRHETHFKNYTKNNKKQYFIYNFDKKLTDNDSIIGMTLENGQLNIAHFKDDTRIKKNNKFLKQCIEAINNQSTAESF